MSSDGGTYYLQRAEAALDQARNATDPEIVRAHVDLANAYARFILAGPPTQQTSNA